MKTCNIGIRSINPHINDKWYLMEFSYSIWIMKMMIMMSEAFCDPNNINISGSYYCLQTIMNGEGQYPENCNDGNNNSDICLNGNELKTEIYKLYNDEKLVRLINDIHGYFSQIIYKCEEIMHQKFNHLTKILLITDVLRIKHNINNGRERNKKIVHYWKNQTSYSCLFLQTQHCGKYTLSQILLGLAH
eukprot:272447_1